MISSNGPNSTSLSVFSSAKSNAGLAVIAVSDKLVYHLLCFVRSIAVVCVKSATGQNNCPGVLSNKCVTNLWGRGIFFYSKCDKVQDRSLPVTARMAAGNQAQMCQDAECVCTERFVFIAAKPKQSKLCSSLFWTKGPEPVLHSPGLSLNLVTSCRQ